MTADPLDGSQRAPDPGLAWAGFPTTTLAAGRQVVRAHAADRDPWWFASLRPDGSGRFDLPSPRGTLYVADDIETAVRERLRHRLWGAKLIPRALADSFIVSQFHLAKARRCADIDDRRAGRFGVSRELSALPENRYTISQQWAHFLDGQGYEGLRYGARFTPGMANAWAVFGSAGQDESPQPAVRQRWAGAQACTLAGLAVASPPRLAGLTVTDPGVDGRSEE